MATKPYIVGITGGSASGKTLLLKKLVSSFQKNSLCIISQDEYYKTKDLQPLDDNGIENYDTPFSIDTELFLKDINTLRSGKEVSKKEYTFNNPNSVPKTLVFKPSPIIIVEGIFVFHHPEISDMLDLKIFIDAKEHIKLKRRIERDQVERGYEIEDVLYRFENHAGPAYEKYIKPLMDDADIIIPNNVRFDKALEVLVSFFKAKLDK